MATRQLLTRLAGLFHDETGVEVQLESVGGVDAARRLQAGEIFDVAVLASDAIAALRADATLAAGGVETVALSFVAAAVRQGRAPVPVDTLPRLTAMLLDCASIGYSTGPSGKALLTRLDSWGILDTLRSRLVQAPPGRPVAAMVAGGEVDIGFQQLSEMIRAPGIAIVSKLPPEAEILTAFDAAECRAATRPDAETARAFIRFLCSDAAIAVKLDEGLFPASGPSGPAA